MELVPGATVERYVVISRLGAGRTATTYHVRHDVLDTHHAMVVPNMRSRKLFALLTAGAKIQAKLRHSGIISCTDILDVDGLPFLIQDHVQGPHLEQFVHFNKLDETRIDGLAGGLMAAVDFLHANSVVHRHLKPQNIIVDMSHNRHTPRITDFMYATVSGTRSLMADGKQRVYGTAPYMSPEQTIDSDNVDHRADLWSLGCLLYLLATGREAFDGGSTEMNFELIRRGRFIPLKKLLPSAPTRWARAIACLLVVEPNDRIQSAEELANMWFEGLATRPTSVALAAPVGKVTLVFTDIEGSTLLWEHAEEVARHSLHAHDAVMRSTLQRFGGYEVKTEGDAFMVAFAEASSALRFCIDVQRQLHKHPWSDGLLERPEAGIAQGFRGLRVRMGVHEGEPECRRRGGRADYYGPMVNRAARVASAGHGGQILVSAETWENANASIRADVIETDLGDYELRSLSGTQRLIQILPDGLESRVFPPIKATRVSD